LAAWDKATVIMAAGISSPPAVALEASVEAAGASAASGEDHLEVVAPAEAGEKRCKYF